MDAACAVSPPANDPPAGRRGSVSGSTVLRLAGVLAGPALVTSLMAATLLTGGCGMSSNANLPDIASKNEPMANGRQPMSAAEQKQAIDAMIAKRDAQTQPQSQPESK